MWKLDGAKPIELEDSEYESEKALENYIKFCSKLVDEDILIIGQQVIVEDVNDRIDLLAIEKDGSVVVIEVKRRQVDDPTILQAFKYASFVANWNAEIIESVGERFYRINENNELLAEGLREFTDFNDILNDFCDEGYTLNYDQKVILVGNNFDKKILSTLYWMNKKGIRIKAVEIRAYTDNDTAYLVSKTVFPLPKNEDLLVGTSARIQDELWKDEGSAWHLINICDSNTSDVLTDLVGHLNSLDDNIPISWNQKEYVGIKAGRNLAIWINTYKSHLWTHIRIENNSLSESDLARLLNLSMDRITVQSEENWDIINFKITNDDNYNPDGFKELALRSIFFQQS